MAYNYYNPYEQRQESDFNLAYGTSDRMNFCLWKINNFFETAQYHNMFTQLQILFNEISTFVNSINRENGTVEPDKEFNEAIRLEKECEKGLSISYIVQKNGDKAFSPTYKLISDLRSYDRYLRALMFKYKLYIKVKDLTLAAAKVG